MDSLLQRQSRRYYSDRVIKFTVAMMRSDITMKHADRAKPKRLVRHLGVDEQAVKTGTQRGGRI